MEETEKACKEAIHAVSVLKANLESAQNENYTLRIELSSRNSPATNDPQNKLTIELLKKEKKDLSERVKQLKAKLLKQNMNGFHLKRENIQLKEQLGIKSNGRINIKTESTEETVNIKHLVKVNKNDAPKSRSKSGLRKVQSRPDLNKKSTEIKSLFDPDQYQRRKSRGSRSILTPYDPNISEIANSRLNMVDLTVCHPLKLSQVKECKRSASVSKLGIKLNHLEGKLKAEKSLNNKIKQRIASMLLDGTTDIYGAQVNLHNTNEPSSELRSTTTTIDSKCGHIQKAFSRFSNFFEQFKQIAD